MLDFLVVLPELLKCKQEISLVSHSEIKILGIKVRRMNYPYQSVQCQKSRQCNTPVYGICWLPRGNSKRKENSAQQRSQRQHCYVVLLPYTSNFSSSIFWDQYIQPYLGIIQDLNVCLLILSNRALLCNVCHFLIPFLSLQQNHAMCHNKLTACLDCYF